MPDIHCSSQRWRLAYLCPMVLAVAAFNGACAQTADDLLERIPVNNACRAAVRARIGEGGSPHLISIYLDRLQNQGYMRIRTIEDGRLMCTGYRMTLGYGRIGQVEVRSTGLVYELADERGLAMFVKLMDLVKRAAVVVRVDGESSLMDSALISCFLVGGKEPVLLMQEDSVLGSFREQAHVWREAQQFDKPICDGDLSELYFSEAMLTIGTLVSDAVDDFDVVAQVASQVGVEKDGNENCR